MKPRLLDAYCCQGGAGEGYRLAGFEVVGVDNVPQPRNPGRVVVGDATETIRKYGHLFDAIHASPPCQHDSKTQRIQSRNHPDLIAATRDAILETGLPYVIENVMDAAPKLIDPVMLCGTMFGLRLYRHRLFETNWPLTAPLHGQHFLRQVKMGRKAGPQDILQPVGNFTGVDEAREAMGMPWATRDGLREAIPPAYTEFIGAQLMAELNASRRAA